MKQHKSGFQVAITGVKPWSSAIETSQAISAMFLWLPKSSIENTHLGYPELVKIAKYTSKKS